MIIEHINILNPFRYLWLKYVTGVDLNVHCARCLKGKYSTRVSPDLTEGMDITLDEFPSDYMYLCGVSKPYRWQNNFHLALRHKPGSVVDINELGIAIRVRDAERIVISKLGNYDHPKGNLAEFNTCRNWQFAYQVSGDYQRGNSDIR